MGPHKFYGENEESDHRAPWMKNSETTVICKGKTLVCLPVKTYVSCLELMRKKIARWNYQHNLPDLWNRFPFGSGQKLQRCWQSAHGCCLMWLCTKWKSAQTENNSRQPYKECRDLVLDKMKRHSKSYMFSDNCTTCFWDSGDFCMQQLSPMAHSSSALSKTLVQV